MTKPPPPPPPPPPGGGYPSGPPTGPPTRPPARGPERSSDRPWVVPGGEPPRSSGLGPEDEELSSRRSPWLLAVAVFGAVALFAGMVAFVTGDDEPGGDSSAPSATDAPDPTSPDTNPPSTTEPPEPVSDEELLAIVDELEAYVSEARGLEWLEDVDVQLVDDATYQERLFRDFEQEVSSIEEAEVFYRSLALLPDPRPLAEQVEDLFSVSTGGVYLTETDELYVSGTTPTPYVQMVIVHELAHALDDQHFELYRPEYEGRDDEIATGFSAIVEGNATRIEEQWLADQSAEDRAAARAEQEAVVDSIDLDGFAPILVYELGSSYSLGSVFAGELAAVGGERQIDAALADPPDTSEQFLFPQLYLEGEPRIAVPRPDAQGEVVDEGVVGASFLFGLLTRVDGAINENDAVRAVEGWGGDWYVTWTEGEGGAVSCVRADFVGDTDDDTGEIERALEVWTSNRGVGDVSTTDDDRVRLESCTASGGGSTPQV